MLWKEPMRILRETLLLTISIPRRRSPRLTAERRSGTQSTKVTTRWLLQCTLVVLMVIHGLNWKPQVHMKLVPEIRKEIIKNNSTINSNTTAASVKEHLEGLRKFSKSQPPNDKQVRNHLHITSGHGRHQRRPHHPPSDCRLHTSQVRPPRKSDLPKGRMVPDLRHRNRFATPPRLRFRERGLRQLLQAVQVQIPTLVLVGLLLSSI